MRDISLHLLDVAENSLNAGAGRVEIEIREDLKLDRFILKIVDDGKGFDLDKKKEDPFFTGKKGKRFGLGLPLLEQAARECEGGLRVAPREGGGTVVEAHFKRSHIDMKPLGDVGSTIASLAAGHPEADYVFRYAVDGASYVLDTAHLRREIEGLPLGHPAVIGFIKDDVNDGIRRVRG
jgi:hypothetical protein